MEQILDQPQSTPQSVRYAGFWIRFVAYVIDAIVLIVAGSIVSGIFFGSLFSSFQGEFTDINWAMYSMANFVNVAMGWLYFSLLESSDKQATLGKMAVGVKVVDRNGQQVSFARATGRYFSKILSGLIFLIGFIMAGFDSRKQALHDKIADTFVVYGR
jgi:uncharacterized RDD family membrane protein YckC